MSPQFISRSALLPDDVAFVILTIVDCHFPFAVLYVKRSVIGIVRMLDMLIFLIPSTTHGAKVLSSSSAVIAFFCMTRPVIISSAKMLSSFNDSSAIWDAVIVLSAIFAAVIFFAPTVGLGYVPARSPPAISGIKSITLPKNYLIFGSVISPVSLFGKYCSSSPFKSSFFAIFLPFYLNPRLNPAENARRRVVTSTFSQSLVLKTISLASIL